MNYLVWPEGRKLYCVLRNKKCEVFNVKRIRWVKYKEENREDYISVLDFVGGDLYKPSLLLTENIMLVYEQQGTKPSQFDAVIEVFGDARFDYQKFSDNAKYSKKQKPTPY